LLGWGCRRETGGTAGDPKGAQRELPCVALGRRAQSPPGGKNGAPGAFWRCLQVGNPTATECGPGCHSASAKYAPSVQQPHGDGRSRGPTEWESDGGERTFTRGDTVGGQQEQRRGAPAQLRPTDGDFRGNRRPGPAHLSLPEAAGLPHPATQSTVPVCALPARLGSTPRHGSWLPRRADLAGLVGPCVQPSAAPFCRPVT
jgi:hypothetical protein